MPPGKLYLPRLKGTPPFIFQWGGNRTPWLSKLLALVFSCVAFGLLLTTVRIKSGPPEKLAPKKASVIFLGDDLESRALSLRAREGGPFPSRFEPSQWEGLAELETSAMNILHSQQKPYVPTVPELPKENQLEALPLAAKGELYFPKRSLVPQIAPDLPKLKLAPALYPLSGISSEAPPRDLPPFHSTINGAMAAASWRFLVRLSPGGVVAECVSLEKGGQPGAPELEDWLHRVQFNPDPAKPFRWIAMGIEFTNQSANGPDAH